MQVLAEYLNITNFLPTEPSFCKKEKVSCCCCRSLRTLHRLRYSICSVSSPCVYFHVLHIQKFIIYFDIVRIQHRSLSRLRWTSMIIIRSLPVRHSSVIISNIEPWLGYTCCSCCCKNHGDHRYCQNKQIYALAVDTYELSYHISVNMGSSKFYKNISRICYRYFSLKNMCIHVSM